MLDLQQRFGHVFANQALLSQALTHRSCGNANNERLEFIGDSILNCFTALLLYETFPTIPEGNMSRVRSGLVRQETLVKVGERIGVEQHLRFNNLDGKFKTGQAMIADAVEAMIGAVYLDAGIDKAGAVVRKHIIDVLNKNEAVLTKDPKTSLQELLQSKGIPLPTYQLIRGSDTGAEHPISSSCEVPSLSIRTTGQGPTKKKAEAEAAAKAIVLLNRR